MHTLGVIHGDLKAVRLTVHLVDISELTGCQANILIDEHRNARLADFGLVTILSTFSTQATTVAVDGVKGTTPFMAPELLAVPDPGSDGPRPSVSSDIYALAVTLWQVRVT
jgi:serine/threonine protein kinase